MAGGLSAGTRIAQNAAQKAAQMSSGEASTVEEVAGLVAEHYAKVRMEFVAADIYARSGRTLQQFHEGIAEHATGVVNAVMSSFELDVDLIVAGVDDAGGHLFLVQNPGGTAQCLDMLGFCAIGIGDIHAMHSMIGFQHGPMDPLKDALFHVFASKRRAELAPGVGHETDLSIVSASGVRHLSSSTLDDLDRINSSVSFSSMTCLSEEMTKLTLEFAPEGGAETTNR